MSQRQRSDGHDGDEASRVGDPLSNLQAKVGYDGAGATLAGLILLSEWQDAPLLLRAIGFLVLGGFALKHAFDTVGLSLVFAITKPENLSSQGVMKRLGMTYRKNVIYKEIEAVWFDIDRATWQAEQTKK